MQKAQLRFDEGFAVALTGRRAQVATMKLAPGASTGGPDNRHQGADQWLYVVSGEGMATVDGRDHVLGPQLLRAARVLSVRRPALRRRERVSCVLFAASPSTDVEAHRCAAAPHPGRRDPR